MNFKKYFEKRKLDDVLVKDLTAKEVEVVSLTATGSDIDEIAKTLFVAPCTVKTHLRNFSLKLVPKTKPTNFRVAICNFYWTYHKELIKRAEKCKK